MTWKFFAIIFGSVFLAEMGDKTQLATILFATNRETNRWIVFLAAAAALVLSSALAVLGGDFLGRFISEKTLRILAGIGFILIGIYTLWRR